MLRTERIVLETGIDQNLFQSVFSRNLSGAHISPFELWAPKPRRSSTELPVKVAGRYLSKKYISDIQVSWCFCLKTSVLELAMLQTIGK